MDLPESVATIASRSRFDHLHPTGVQYQDRYGSVYEALAGLAGQQLEVALRLLDRPDEPDGQFSNLITELLGSVAPITDHERLLDVVDYGEQPRPWLVTPTVSERLADRTPMDFVSPLTTATEIVEGVVHLHRNDRTHGGLDPQSVVFVGDRFGDVVQGSPKIDNSGLLAVYRHHFEPATYLEPAYAAPEYYSQEFGDVDNQTDVYHVGAVLYYLFTGRAPFTGSFERIQAKVLQAGPPKPSSADAPPEFDDIVTKAMAREKIRRYETVQHLQRDLERLVINREYEWVPEE